MSEQKLDKEIEKQLDDAFWNSKPASSGDCTGLITGLPEDQESIESYETLYNIPHQGALKELMNPDGTMEGSSEQINE